MNTQEAFRLFHNKLKEIHDKCFPLQTISKTYNTRKPWLTDSLRDAIKKKNKLYYLSKKIKCLRNEINYKEYRNKLKKVLKAAEKKHHCDILIQNKTNSKKMWNVIKNVINRNKKTELQSKFKLSDGTVTTDLKLVTEKFNDFFVNVGPTLARKIPEQDRNPEYFMQSRAVFSLYLEPVTETEVANLVNPLKSSAPGLYSISSSILKLVLPSICSPLTHICNLSLQEGTFPDGMNIAYVLPLFKSDDPEIFNNYRPVSVLCSLSKVFERVMYNRVIDYLNKYRILFSYQFGFRKCHSTYMSLMILMDKLIISLDNGDCVKEESFSRIFPTIIPFFILITTSNTKVLISKYRDEVIATRIKTTS